MLEASESIAESELDKMLETPVNIMITADILDETDTSVVHNFVQSDEKVKRELRSISPQFNVRKRTFKKPDIKAQQNTWNAYSVPVRSEDEVQMIL